MDVVELLWCPLVAQFTLPVHFSGAVDVLSELQLVCKTARRLLLSSVLLDLLKRNPPLSPHNRMKLYDLLLPPSHCWRNIEHWGNAEYDGLDKRIIVAFKQIDMDIPRSIHGIRPRCSRNADVLRALRGAIAPTVAASLPHLPSPRSPTSQTRRESAVRTALRCVALSNPDIGYTQGLDFLAIHLSKITPTPCPSFTFSILQWCLSDRGLSALYRPPLSLLKEVNANFEIIFRIELPVLSEHFTALAICPSHLTMSWFQTLFCYVPNIPSVVVGGLFDRFVVSRGNWDVYYAAALAIFKLLAPLLLVAVLETVMCMLCELPDSEEIFVDFVDIVDNIEFRSGVVNEFGADPIVDFGKGKPSRMIRWAKWVFCGFLDE